MHGIALLQVAARQIRQPLPCGVSPNASATSGKSRISPRAGVLERNMGGAICPPTLDRKLRLTFSDGEFVPSALRVKLDSRTLALCN